MTEAAAVLEAAPDAPAGLVHGDDDALAVDSVLSWELGKDLAASGFAEPAVEDAIETHPDTMPTDDDVDSIAQRWIADLLSTLEALEWAGSEICQTHGGALTNSVALVAMVAPAEAGATSHVARWITFNDRATWEGRFVTVSANHNYRIEYTMPTEKDVFADRISSGEITFIIPNTQCNLIRPLHLREEMHPSAVRVWSMFNGLETDSPVCFICGQTILRRETTSLWYGWGC